MPRFEAIARVAGLVLLVVGCTPALAFRLEVTPQPGSPKLCLAIDERKPIVSAPNATIVPDEKTPPIPMQAGTFYPAVVADCASLPPGGAGDWTMTDTRELQAKVRGATACLSLRTRRGLAPLAEAYLGSFGAADPGSPFAYLVAGLKADALAKGPPTSRVPVLASACGRSDAADFWFVDPVNGMISAPNHRDCLAVAGDPLSRPKRFQAGMPVFTTGCGDLWSDAAEPFLRWSIAGPARHVPTYSAGARTGDYFSGRGGLPITGPMGRCLTADLPSNRVVTSDCDNRVEQRWLFTGSAVVLGDSGKCLALLARGTVLLRPCGGTAEQGWSYDNPDPVPNRRWRHADVYARIHPLGQADQCLVVSDDPFVDPMRQRNPVKVAACGAVLPRQVSWFVADKVRTIRLAVVRFAADDDRNPANGSMNDDQMKAMLEVLAGRLSEQYTSLGLRFVFIPALDFMRRRDTVANQARNVDPDGTPNWDSPHRLTTLAATVFSGKAVIGNMAGYHGGGSSGGMAEFEPARMINIVTGGPETSFTRVPGLPRDKFGLHAVSMTVAEGGVGSAPRSSGHHAHEFGHYFGLGHTFDQDLWGDTPDDLPTGDAWIALGTITCGNPRTVTVKGRTFTPDRLNNEGYFGCQLGRTHNAFSPLQLGYMVHQLYNFPNRYPLVACQPIGSYDADHVECENEESLARCRETAAYLAEHARGALDCRPGGNVARAAADALAQPAIRFLFEQTPQGRALFDRMAGGRATVQNAAAVMGALAAATNLPLTMAVVTRLAEYRAHAVASVPTLARTGFLPGSGTPGPAEARALRAAAQAVFLPGFLENVPSLLPK